MLEASRKQIEIEKESIKHSRGKSFLDFYECERAEVNIRFFSQLWTFILLQLSLE